MDNFRVNKMENAIKENFLYRNEGFMHIHGAKYKSIARILFGFMWLANASLKLSPVFTKNFLTLVEVQSIGQSGFFALWYKFWITIIKPIPWFWVFVITFTEFSLAICLIFGFLRKTGYIAGVITSLIIWGVPERFGGPYNAYSTNIGIGIVYAMVFLVFIALNALEGPSKYSVDYYIEKKFRFWRFLAEFS